MDIFQLASYGASGNTNTSGVSNNQTPARAQSTSGSGLDMTDFLKLLAAQFSNQDITNPTSNTEYISELAQFASIQAMNTLTNYADSQYAASLVGKKVVVAKYDSTGKMVKDTGVVSYVDFTSADGSTLVVNGTAYGLSNVMQVLSDSTADPNPTDPKPVDPTPTDPGSETPKTGNDETKTDSTQEVGGQ